MTQTTRSPARDYSELQAELDRRHPGKVITRDRVTWYFFTKLDLDDRLRHPNPTYCHVGGVPERPEKPEFPSILKMDPPGINADKGPKGDVAAYNAHVDQIIEEFLDTASYEQKLWIDWQMAALGYSTAIVNWGGDGSHTRRAVFARAFAGMLPLTEVTRQRTREYHMSFYGALAAWGGVPDRRKGSRPTLSSAEVERKFKENGIDLRRAAQGGYRVTEVVTVGGVSNEDYTTWRDDYLEREHQREQERAVRAEHEREVALSDPDEVTQIGAQIVAKLEYLHPHVESIINLSGSAIRRREFYSLSEKWERLDATVSKRRSDGKNLTKSQIQRAKNIMAELEHLEDAMNSFWGAGGPLAKRVRDIDERLDQAKTMAERTDLGIPNGFVERALDAIAYAQEMRPEGRYAIGEAICNAVERYINHLPARRGLILSGRGEPSGMHQWHRNLIVRYSDKYRKEHGKADLLNADFDDAPVWDGLNDEVHGKSIREAVQQALFSAEYAIRSERHAREYESGVAEWDPTALVLISNIEERVNLAGQWSDYVKEEDRKPGLNKFAKNQYDGTCAILERALSRDFSWDHGSEVRDVIQDLLDRYRKNEGVKYG